MNNKTAHFDEMVGEAGVRDPYVGYRDWFDVQDPARLTKKSEDAEAFFRRTGITFNVYGQSDAEERLIPFDLVPRIVSGREWTKLSRGIDQRVRAINAFLHDIYNRQEILRAGIVPVELVAQNDAFLPQMIDFSPPGDVYTHIVGTDIVRTGQDDFFVLEDNARTPSGVSYMLENRETMLQMFPELFSKIKVQRVSNYPKNLRRSLEASAPPGCEGRPCVVVLTPGIHNSAYYEHSFLADQMGVELVEG
ncbi:MAG: circularly permuted type 2 ATP-grasp protein, partial [Octadecabacter sp.]|nr:circularly permuted type 2 ATP-grasp protein [Octadecabacter sp.]